MLNVGKELAALGRMAPKDLRAKYAEVFGEETKTANKAWLVKRIACRVTPPREAGARDLAAPPDLNAYFFHVRALAWRRLCREIGVDPDALVAGNYMGWILPYFEEQIVKLVPDKERILRRLAEWGKSPKEIMDAQSEYQSLRGLLAKMTHDLPRFKDAQPPS